MNKFEDFGCPGAISHPNSESIWEEHTPLSKYVHVHQSQILMHSFSCAIRNDVQEIY